MDFRLTRLWIHDDGARKTTFFYKGLFGVANIKLCLVNVIVERHSTSYEFIAVYIPVPNIQYRLNVTVNYIAKVIYLNQQQLRFYMFTSFFRMCLCECLLGLNEHELFHKMGACMGVYADSSVFRFINDLQHYVDHYSCHFRILVK